MNPDNTTPSTFVTVTANDICCQILRGQTSLNRHVTKWDDNGKLYFKSR